MKKLKRYTFLILIVFLLLISNKVSKSQCILSTTPSCLQVGNNITITCDNSGGGIQVTDPNGNIVLQSTTPPFVFSPSNVGNYLIQYSGGFFGPFCSTTIYVTNQPIQLSLSNKERSIALCTITSSCL